MSEKLNLPGCFPFSHFILVSLCGHSHSVSWSWADLWMCAVTDQKSCCPHEKTRNYQSSEIQRVGNRLARVLYCQHGRVWVAAEARELTLKLEICGSLGSVEQKTLEKLRMMMEVWEYVCVCVHKVRNEYFHGWYLRKNGLVCFSILNFIPHQWGQLLASHEKSKYV